MATTSISLQGTPPSPDSIELLPQECRPEHSAAACSFLSQPRYDHRAQAQRRCDLCTAMIDRVTLEVVSRAGIVLRSNDNSSNFSVVRRSDILVECWKSAKCHAEKWCCRLKSRPIRSPFSHTPPTSRMGGTGLGAF